jgi:class 3 adenylate cyclase/tetratricopeptide (TPR) repeat protein
MRCPRCQHENPPQAKFCLECGGRLAPACASCGAELPADSKFCNRCGTPVAMEAPTQPRFAWPESYTPKHLAEKILTSKSALEGERKQVTVLFADLKGSMELLADRDPEEARKILDPVLERMMDAVHRYEGTVNQVMGDGIMALFGAPLAHEDHAVRACYAALRMQDAVRRYAEEVQRTQAVPIHIRVGVNSGEVVVRSIGSDLRMDYTAVGQTTHLAARMEQMAMPGTILLTAEALRLAEGYVQVRAVGPVPIKGLERPVEVYEVTGSGPVRSRLQASAARGLTRFVGRDAELGALRQALERARVGHGQVAAVVGEPGVGKSRLFLEFTRSHRTEGWRILESGSVSYGKATAYLPVIDLLKAYFKVEERDNERDIREKITGKLLALDRTLESALPPILTLLDTAVDDAVWCALDPPNRRRQTIDAVKRLLLRESQVQPLVLVFEDLHWIDDATQEFLDSVVGSLPGARVLLLVNYRPEYEHRWGGRTYYTQLRIDPLSAESAEDLLEALLGPDAALTPLKQLLIERTEGNPFFLEESIRTLVEAEVLVGDRGAYRLARPVEGLQVPATVQAVLAARIDRLPSDEKRLLQTAAAIGVDVPFAVLQAIAATSEETLRRGLSHLQAAEFLYETALFPDLEYRFKHALTHEVAYGSLLRERRRELHGAVGRALEELYAERLTEHCDKLAHHFMRAEDWDRAVRYSVLAGQRAEDAYASAEAASHYRRGLEATARMNPPLEVTSVADLHRRYAGSLDSLTEYDASIAEYQQALELVRQIGDRTREAAILAEMSVTLGRDHRAEKAVDFNEQSMAAARDLGNHRLEAVCLVQRARLRAVWHGDLGPAMADAEAALRLADSMGDARLHADIAAAIGTFLQWRGQYTEALSLLRECARLGETQRDAALFARASYFVITTCASLGEYEEALAWYRRLSDYAFSADDKFWMARVPNLAGGIHLELFDLDTAIRLNLEGEEIARKVYRWPEPRGHCLLKTGLAYLQQGELGRATELFGRARAFLADDQWLRWRWEIPLLRAEAELALAEGRPDDAWRQAAESLALAAGTGSRKHMARARTAQGEILAASGRLDEATAAFESSIALAEEMGTPREHWIAQAALGRTFYRLGRDEAAEAAYRQAARVIDALAATLTTPRLRQSFLAAEPVLEVYRALGRGPAPEEIRPC